MGSTGEAFFQTHQRSLVARQAGRIVKRDGPVGTHRTHVVALRGRADRNHRSAGAVEAVIVNAIKECMDKAAPHKISSHDQIVGQLPLHAQIQVNGMTRVTA